MIKSLIPPEMFSLVKAYHKGRILFKKEFLSKRNKARVDTTKASQGTPRETRLIRIRYRKQARPLNIGLHLFKDIDKFEAIRGISSFTTKYMLGK